MIYEKAKFLSGHQIKKLNKIETESFSKGNGPTFRASNLGSR